MKKIMIAFLLSALFLTGCSSNSDKKSTDNKSNVQVQTNSSKKDDSTKTDKDKKDDSTQSQTDEVKKDDIQKNDSTKEGSSSKSSTSQVVNTTQSSATENEKTTTASVDKSVENKKTDTTTQKNAQQDTQEQSSKKLTEKEYYDLIKKALQEQSDYIKSIKDPKIQVRSSVGAAVGQETVLEMKYPEDTNIIREALQKVLAGEGVTQAQTDESKKETSVVNNAIANEVKNYIINGQGDVSQSQKLKWSESFLNQVDTNSLYNQYIANGGGADKVEDFAKYITSNAKAPSNWQELFKADFKAKTNLDVSKFEKLQDNLYQVYVEKDGSVVPYVTVSSVTGYYHS